jgi:hypothetical protein
MGKAEEDGWQVAFTYSKAVAVCLAWADRFSQSLAYIRATDFKSNTPYNAFSRIAVCRAINVLKYFSLDPAQLDLKSQMLPRRKSAPEFKPSSTIRDLTISCRSIVECGESAGQT